MSDSLRLLRKGWRNNYRAHGGLRAFARCWSGDRKLHQGRALPEPDPLPKIDCTVFSVIPQLSALWAVLFERVVGIRPMRVLLGDCSGGLRGGTGTCLVTPMLNRHHGEKLDAVFDHLCRADVVLATDDDIFWLDEEPLRWALDRLAAEPEIAVVGVVPKRQRSEVLVGQVEHAMGSVLVVRRDLWMREGLSFRVAYPPPEAGLNWLYDTGELAQVELGRRGYRVEFGPEELRRYLPKFDGVSTWTLKMRKYRGEIGAAVGDSHGRQFKALQTVYVLRGLARLYAELPPGRRNTDVLSPAILDRAESICRRRLAPEVAESVREWVAEDMGRVRKKLLDLGEPRELGRALDRLLAK